MIASNKKKRITNQLSEDDWDLVEAEDDWTTTENSWLCPICGNYHAQDDNC